MAKSERIEPAFDRRAVREMNAADGRAAGPTFPGKTARLGPRHRAPARQAGGHVDFAVLRSTCR